jgi:hypothetical protein
MSTYKSDFLNVLANRGFIHQVSEPEALDARALAARITAYIGFDCTAPSLHVGSLVQIMMLYWAQQTGLPDRAHGRRHDARRRPAGGRGENPHRRDITAISPASAPCSENS